MKKKIDLWYEYAERLIHLSHNVMARANVQVTENGGRDIKVISLLLLCRTRSNLKGVLLLLKAQRIVEARIVARCIIENQLFAGAIKDKGEKFIDTMERSHIGNRRKMGQALANNGIKDELKEKLFNYLRNTKNQQQRDSISPKEVAKGGPVEGAYLFYQQLSADAGHLGFDTLERYFSASPEDGIITVDVEPLIHDDEIEETLNFSCMAMLCILIVAIDLSEIETFQEDIQEITEQYKKIIS